MDLSSDCGSTQFLTVTLAIGPQGRPVYSGCGFHHHPPLLSHFCSFHLFLPADNPHITNHTYGGRAEPLLCYNIPLIYSPPQPALQFLNRAKGKLSEMLPLSFPLLPRHAESNDSHPVCVRGILLWKFYLAVLSPGLANTAICLPHLSACCTM